MCRILPCEDRRLLNQITWFMRLQIYSISRKVEMKKILIIYCVACLTVGFFLGRMNVREKEVTKYVQGATLRDTITRFVPDTVYLAGELKYKYVYVSDTIYKDVPVIDREATIAATVKDWNRTKEYNKLLFDNESGKLSIAFSVQYNELQKLSYTFTPMYKEITIVKKRVFVPFISASVLDFNSVSVGGGFFYHDLGFRAEWVSNGLNFGIMYKF